MNQHELIKLANFKMPFGKYKDKYLVYIPEEYITWLINNHSLNNNLKSKLYNWKINIIKRWECVALNHQLQKYSKSTSF